MLATDTVPQCRQKLPDRDIVSNPQRGSDVEHYGASLRHSTALHVVAAKACVTPRPRSRPGLVFDE
eukprot:2904425-Prymnesium_polylepis.1